MNRMLLWVVLASRLLSAAEGTDGHATADSRLPVLVELFTSEGCSSCPPADALLERFDRTQPLAGAQIIVLSEHVDYWNHIGWADPYSSPAFSARQQVYARRFGAGDVYTPQMVVDGRSELVGSDARAAESAIRAALRQTKVPVRILDANGNPGSADVEVDALSAGLPHKANVYVAYASEDGTSDVLRGENKGRRLHHVAIARDLRQVGAVDRRSGFKTQVPLKTGTRLIVFVQEPGNGPIWGAAMQPANR